MRRCAVLIASLVCIEIFCVAICTTTVSGQTALEKLRVTYSAIGGSQASVWIPYEAGIFRKTAWTWNYSTSLAAAARGRWCNRAKSP